MLKLLTILVALLLTTMSQAVFTNNPDDAGISWEGVIHYEELNMRRWLQNVSSAGADTSTIRFAIDNGTVYINKSPDELNITDIAFNDAAFTVSTTSNTNIQLNHNDYFVFLYNSSIQWRSPFDPALRIMIHSNLIKTGGGGPAITSYNDGSSSPEDPTYDDGAVQQRDLWLRQQHDGTIRTVQPSYTNRQNQNYCYTDKNLCMSTDGGYKLVVGTALVSGINWIIAWSHHMCRVPCGRPTTYGYFKIQHRNVDVGLRLYGNANIYSSALITQRDPPSISWGWNRALASCGSSTTLWPACDPVT